MTNLLNAILVIVLVIALVEPWLANRISLRNLAKPRPPTANRTAPHVAEGAIR